MSEFVKTIDAGADKEVKYWLVQLDGGIKRREEEYKYWDHNEAVERLKDREFGTLGDYIPINKVGAWMKTRRAALAFHNPQAKMEPATAAGYAPVEVPVLGEDGNPQMQMVPDAQGNPQFGPDNQPIMAPVTKRVLRHKVREAIFNEIVTSSSFGMAKAISRVTNAGALAYGSFKVGSKPVFETPPEKDIRLDVPMGPGGVMDFSEFVENPMNPDLPMLDDDNKPIRKSDVPVGEEYFIDWQDYRQLIHDPNGGNDFSQHRWVAVEVVRNLAEVKADPMLANTKDLKATHEISDKKDERYRAINSEIADEDIRERDSLIRLFEIYDLVNNRLIVLADGHGKFLRDEVMPEGITGCPLTFYRPYELLGEWYCRPPVSDLAPIADGINAIIRLIHIAGKGSSLRKWVNSDGGLTPDAQKALRSDEDGAIVTIEGNPYGADKVLQALKMPDAGQSLYQFLNVLERMFDEVGGLGASTRGQMTGGTATEAEKVSAGEGVRLGFDRAVLVDTIIETFEKLNDSIDANMTRAQAVRLVGEDGEAFMGEVGKEMITGAYRVKIDLQEMKHTDDAVQGAQKLQLIAAAGQNPWAFADEVLCRGWCESFGIKDENFIKALAAKAQEQIQMQQMVQMAAMTPPPGAATGPGNSTVPNAPPPTNTADAISQTAAGGQVPNMQGAS